MSVSKSCFYNDCVLHPEADKTSTHGRISYQYYYSSFDQPKKNFNRPKKGSGQNHFRPKKWYGHGRTGRTADDGLEYRFSHNVAQVIIEIFICLQNHHWDFYESNWCYEMMFYMLIVLHHLDMMQHQRSHFSLTMKRLQLLTRHQ